jgi:hypothetical protein
MTQYLSVDAAPTTGARDPVGGCWFSQRRSSRSAPSFATFR